MTSASTDRHARPVVYYVAETADGYTTATSPQADVTSVRDSADEAVSSPRAQARKSIWLCGGAQLASTLLSAGLVDELVLKPNPVLSGSGIPVVAGGIDLTRLRLLDNFVHPSWHIRLHYRIES